MFFLRDRAEDRQDMPRQQSRADHARQATGKERILAGLQAARWQQVDTAHAQYRTRLQPFRTCPYAARTAGKVGIPCRGQRQPWQRWKGTTGDRRGRRRKIRHAQHRQPQPGHARPCQQVSRPRAGCRGGTGLQHRLLFGRLHAARHVRRVGRPRAAARRRRAGGHDRGLQEYGTHAQGGGIPCG